VAYWILTIEGLTGHTVDSVEQGMEMCVSVCMCVLVSVCIYVCLSVCGQGVGWREG